MDNASTARLMDGRSLSRKVIGEAALRATAFYDHIGRRPCLAVVFISATPASNSSVELKRTRCEEAGLEARLIELPDTVTTKQMVETLTALSQNPSVDGILLQYPIPRGVDERAAFEAIAPTKDVDGVTTHSFGVLAFGFQGFAACTAAGIIRLLDEYEVNLKGKRTVVLGRSPILGKPIGMLLLARDATVTFCHSYSEDLVDIVRSGDIVVAAVNEPRMVRGRWIKPGAVVVDAGYGQERVGAIALEEVRRSASLIAPVPGGVGPMTIAVLIENTVFAAERKALIASP
jgi:methylenetetrahydrofolate dehydrogenase (NADP+) / methenyltetrahydrofolate cyclohydrolase